MTSSVNNGRAFEWATATALSHQLGVPIEPSSGATKARVAFESLDPKMRGNFDAASAAATEHILELEGANPAVIAAQRVSFNTHAAGQGGDVRDLILLSNDCTLGFSCKNNHSALKHSRLSGTINFVSDWRIDEEGCSREYFDAVGPIFERLKIIRDASNGDALWRERDDIYESFYQPVLDAFQSELRRCLTGESAEIRCGSLHKYLVGTVDFYKVMNRHSDGIVEIQGWNLNSTLNVKTLHQPTALIDLRPSETSPNTVVLFLNRGFTFGFRIHSASSKIEPSLKFDINAVGIPPSLYTNHIYV